MDNEIYKISGAKIGVVGGNGKDKRIVVSG